MESCRSCFTLDISEAVRILSIFGIVTSVIKAIAAGCLFGLPSLEQAQRFHIREGDWIQDWKIASNFATLNDGLRVFLICVNIGWLIFSLILYKKNTNDDAEGVKKMIKIGSFLIGFIQIAYFAILLVFGLCHLFFLLSKDNCIS